MNEQFGPFLLTLISTIVLMAALLDLLARQNERPTKIYVSELGDDTTGDGSQARPYRSLAVAARRVAGLHQRGKISRLSPCEIHLGVGCWGEDITLRTPHTRIIGAGSDTIIKGRVAING